MATPHIHAMMPSVVVIISVIILWSFISKTLGALLIKQGGFVGQIGSAIVGLG